MNNEETIRAKCEELFCTHPWAGTLSVQEAIADVWHQRMELSEGDRQAFDEQVLMGIHPVRALETVELMSGRAPSRMHRKPIGTPVSKAS